MQQLSNKILLIFHKADLSCIGLKISSLNVNSFSHKQIVVSRTDKQMTKKEAQQNFHFHLISSPPKFTVEGLYETTRGTCSL